MCDFIMYKLPNQQICQFRMRISEGMSDLINMTTLINLVQNKIFFLNVRFFDIFKKIQILEQHILRTYTVRQKLIHKVKRGRKVVSSFRVFLKNGFGCCCYSMHRCLNAHFWRVITSNYLFISSSYVKKWYF